KPHRPSVQSWQLRTEAVRKTQERRRQRQARSAGSGPGIARLFVIKRIGLEGIQLDSLCFNIPGSHLEVMTASEPGEIGRDTPIRIFAQRSTTNARVTTAAGGPVL